MFAVQLGNGDVCSRPIRRPTVSSHCAASYRYGEGTGAAKAACPEVEFEIALQRWLSWTQKIPDEESTLHEEKMES